MKNLFLYEVAVPLGNWLHIFVQKQVNELSTLSTPTFKHELKIMFSPM